MLSFLPKKHKQNLLLEYKLKFSTAIAGSISVLCVIALVGLLPSYLNEKAQADALRVQLDAENTTEEQKNILRKQANQTYSEHLAGEIKKLSAKNKPSDVVSAIIAAKPAGISIQAIQFGEKVVSVSGIADTRSNLISFEKALKENGAFKEANLPISDITKNVDAPFTINVTVK